LSWRLSNKRRETRSHGLKQQGSDESVEDHGDVRVGDEHARMLRIPAAEAHAAAQHGSKACSEVPHGERRARG
jgi:hypothetical protein